MSAPNPAAPTADDSLQSFFTQNIRDALPWPLSPLGGWSQDGPYWWYQTLVLLRSFVIIGCLILAELLFRKHSSLMPLVYRSLKPTPKHLYVHNVCIMSHDPRALHRIHAAYQWVMRVCVVLVVCYLWDSLLVPSMMFDLRKMTDWNSVIASCSTGWDCFALQYPNETVANVNWNSVDGFLRVSFVWDLRNICPYFRDVTSTATGSWTAPDMSKHSPRDAAALCQSSGTFTFTALVGGLAICAALSILVVAVFEGLTALLMRHRSRRCCSLPMLIDIVLILSLVIWIAMLVWEALTSIACWVSRLTLLSIPVVIWNARSLAAILRSEMLIRNEERAKELQEADLGLDVAELMHPTDDVVLESQLTNRHQSTGSRHGDRRHRAKEKAHQIINRIKYRGHNRKDSSDSLANRRE